MFFDRTGINQEEVWIGVVSLKKIRFNGVAAYQAGITQQKFHTGRPRPEVKPLTLLFTIFWQKSDHLPHTFY